MVTFDRTLLYTPTPPERASYSIQRFWISPVMRMGCGKACEEMGVKGSESVG